MIVGVNRYQVAGETPLEILRIDPALERQQVERVQELRARRDSAAVEAALAKLREGAAGDANLMPLIVDASRAYVTMGEMCDALREVWGIWRETPVFSRKEPRWACGLLGGCVRFSSSAINKFAANQR